MDAGHYQTPQPQGAWSSGQVILRDGSTATLRPAKPEDHELLTTFLTQVARESYYRRFFAATPEIEAATQMLSINPLEHKLVLLVLTGDPIKPRLLATGEYIQEAPASTNAEVAFIVDDALHGRGLGTLLLERLALVAARHGITRFTALTMARNRAMINMFLSSGFQVERHLDSGEVELDFSILPSRVSVERMELRERVATIASLYPFFKPRRVAVLSLSATPRNASQQVLEHLLASGFSGTLSLVNPNVADAYSKLADLPEAPELAILALPQAHVIPAVAACGEAGVRALVIMSAGFAEAGPDGEVLQAKLTQQVRAYGMRLIGPNSLGLLNTHIAASRKVGLNVSLAPKLPQPGNIAVSSQSGALGLAILEHADAAGLGLSSFVSLGNKADVSSNDLLQFWEDDADTHLIILYLASFGNPRRFARLARRVGRQKPILVVKANEGGQAEVATEALFRQTGVIRAATFEELLDVAKLLSHQPLPTGPRVGILTNASGPAALAANTLLSGGLKLPQPTHDLTAFADPEAYRRALTSALTNPSFDALFVIFSPVGPSDSDTVGAVLGKVVEAARSGGNFKPVLSCFTGSHKALFAGTERLPSYRFPESAARALARAYTYARWRAEPLGELPIFTDLRTDQARHICHAVRDRGGGWLAPDQVEEILRAFGILLSPPAEPLPECTQFYMGVQPDPLFGPIVTFGLGGRYSDVLHDKIYRVTPLTERDATEMVRSLRAFPLLKGYQGHPESDVDALETLLLRISRLVEELPEVEALELSPVWASAPGHGAVVVAARLSVSAGEIDDTEGL